MQAFEAIDVLALATVTGGEKKDPPPAANTKKFSLEGTAGAKIYGAPVGLNGKLDIESTADTPTACADRQTDPDKKLKCYELFAPK